MGPGRRTDDNEPQDARQKTHALRGLREIRARDENGIFRVMYVAEFKDAMYVPMVVDQVTRRLLCYDAHVVALLVYGFVAAGKPLRRTCARHGAPPSLQMPFRSNPVALRYDIG